MDSKHLKQYSQQQHQLVSDLEEVPFQQHSHLELNSSQEEAEEYDEEEEDDQYYQQKHQQHSPELDGISRKELADKIKQMKDKIRLVQQEQREVMSIEELKEVESSERLQSQPQGFQKEDLRSKINQMKQAIASMNRSGDAVQHSDMFITEESDFEQFKNKVPGNTFQQPQPSSKISSYNSTNKNKPTTPYTNQTNQTTFGSKTKSNGNILILTNGSKGGANKKKELESENEDDQSHSQDSTKHKQEQSEERTPPSSTRDNRQQRGAMHRRGLTKGSTLSPNSSTAQENISYPLQSQTTNAWYQHPHQQQIPPYLQSTPQTLQNPFLFTQQQPLFTQQSQQQAYLPQQAQPNLDFLTSLHIPTHTHTPSSISSSLYYPPQFPQQHYQYPPQHQQHKPASFFPPTASPDIAFLQHLNQQSHSFIQQLQMRIAEQDKELQQKQQQTSLAQPLKQENQQLLLRNEELVGKLEDMQREMSEQRDFYEQALEERFNQMEQFENECIQLRDQLQKAGEHTSAQRKWEHREAEIKAVHEARQQEMLEKVEEAEGQLRDAIVLCEKRAEENFTLKQKIDQQRQELEKARKRAEVLEDQAIQREGELKMAREDIEKMQKRQKTLYPQQDYQQLKDEVNSERVLNAELRTIINTLEGQNQELESKLAMTEQKPSINRINEYSNPSRLPKQDNSRIIQQHATQHKRIASNFYGQMSDEYQQQQPLKKNNEMSQNRENQTKHTGFTDDPNAGQLPSARLVGRGRLQSAKQNHSPMKQLLYNEQEIVDESEITDVAEAAMKYQLPPSFFQDLSHPSSVNPYNGGFPSQNSQHRNVPLITKPKTIQNFAVSTVGESGSSLNQARILSNNRERPTSSNHGPYISSQDLQKERKNDQIKTFETQLLQIQLEQRKLQNELDKLPESGPRTIAQRKRREEVERELQIATKNISGIRNKLRELEALRK